jgi:hypothetical protein
MKLRIWPEIGGGSTAGLLLAISCTLSAAGGCASSKQPAASRPPGDEGGAGGASAYGSATAEEAIREFLAAAQAQEYSRMRRLFGTKDGPAERRWGVQEVEQRMVVLSGMLLHESYTLRPLELGYLRDDQRGFVATIIGTRYGSASVPITTVFSNGRWYVEQLGVDSLVGEGS